MTDSFCPRCGFPEPDPDAIRLRCDNCGTSEMPVPAPRCPAFPDPRRYGRLTPGRCEMPAGHAGCHVSGDGGWHYATATPPADETRTTDENRSMTERCVPALSAYVVECSDRYTEDPSDENRERFDRATDALRTFVASI